MTAIAIALAVSAALATLAWWDVQRRRTPKEPPDLLARMDKHEQALKNALIETRETIGKLSEQVTALRAQKNQEQATKFTGARSTPRMIR